MPCQVEDSPWVKQSTATAAPASAKPAKTAPRPKDSP